MVDASQSYCTCVLYKTDNSTTTLLQLYLPRPCYNCTYRSPATTVPTTNLLQLYRYLPQPCNSKQDTSYLSPKQKFPSFNPGSFPAGFTAKYSAVLCSPPTKSTSLMLTSRFRCLMTICTKREGGLNFVLKKVTLSSFGCDIINLVTQPYVVCKQNFKIKS